MTSFFEKGLLTYVTKTIPRVEIRSKNVLIVPNSSNWCRTSSLLVSYCAHGLARNFHQRIEATMFTRLNVANEKCSTRTFSLNAFFNNGVVDFIVSIFTHGTPRTTGIVVVVIIIASGNIRRPVWWEQYRRKNSFTTTPEKTDKSRIEGSLHADRGHSRSR